MSDETGIVVNCMMDAGTAKALADGESGVDGVEVDSIRKAEHVQASRFGAAEATAVVVFVKTILEVVKLASWLRDKLAGSSGRQRSATLETPDGKVHIEITGDMDPETVKVLVDKAFARAAE